MPLYGAKPGDGLGGSGTKQDNNSIVGESLTLRSLQHGLLTSTAPAGAMMEVTSNRRTSVCINE